MDSTILIPVLITSLIWIIISIIVYVVSKKRTEHILRASNEKLEQAHTEFTNKLETLLYKKNEALREAYNNGFLDAETKKGLSIQIIPWKEEVNSSTLFKNKKSIKVGYKHQLFSNGMPCFEPHITVVEDINLDQLNEEHVHRVFDNLELVMNTIPNTGHIAVKVLGSGKDMAQSILKLAKKKRA
ncbi:hypothetical protein ACFFU9_15490 [Mariniflexile ostreae]|uniref:2'-5' RNA ligase superfamily protein n=1 Tax=Mariniflexile ostreae TaxID=1520892 RepID=A0ABV5FFA7_9FLAO